MWVDSPVGEEYQMLKCGEKCGEMFTVSEALFCLCRGTNIYNSFWGASEFQDTYHGFLYFFDFFYFSQWILYIAGARETQEDTL